MQAAFLPIFSPATVFQVRAIPQLSSSELFLRLTICQALSLALGLGEPVSFVKSPIAGMG